MSLKFYNVCFYIYIEITSISQSTDSVTDLQSNETLLMKLKESKLNIQTLQHLVIGFASKLIAQVTKESLNLINILNIQEAKIDDFIKEAQNVSLSSENIPPFLEIKDMDFLFTSLTNAVSAFFSLTAFQKAESITSTITISEAFQGILLLAEISKGSVNQFVYPFPEASKVSINHYQTTLCSNIYFKHNYSFLKPPYLVDLRNSSCLSLSDNYEPSKNFSSLLLAVKNGPKPIHVLNLAAISAGKSLMGTFNALIVYRIFALSVLNG